MILSLFSGCGGLDLGFERAGFTVGLAYDIRSSAIASWNRNRPNTHCRGYVADLTAIHLKDMDDNYGEKFEPSGVIGGPPCQSFSRANHFRSDADPRHRLVRHFFTIALRFHRNRRPLDFILMENVPELAKAENGKLLARERKRLKQHGFELQKLILDAACYSVPQHRKRLFLLAVPENKLMMKLWTSPSRKNTKRTVGDAIRNLPQPVHFQRGLRHGAFHPNHWCMTPKSHKFFDGSLVAGDSSGRSFKTLGWNTPSITVSYGNREVHVHPDGQRRLSVFEAMRLQGFPDDYVLEGTLSAQIDQVSEAVPPPLAEAVAISIRSIQNSNKPDTNNSTSYYISSSLNTSGE